MKFLFFLIFILGIAGGGYFGISNYEQKISTLNMDKMLLKKQLSKLQDQYKKLDTIKNKCTIQFLNLDNHYGIIPKGSLIYLSPYVDSCVLQTISIAMEVGILEKAIVDNIVWYYIALPIETNINCRGWIDESSFSNLSPSKIDLISK